MGPFTTGPEEHGLNATDAYRSYRQRRLSQADDELRYAVTWVWAAVAVALGLCAVMFMRTIKSGTYQHVRVRVWAWKLFGVEVELDRDKPDRQ